MVMRKKVYIISKNYFFVVDIAVLVIYYLIIISDNISPQVLNLTVTVWSNNFTPG